MAFLPALARKIKTAAGLPLFTYLWLPFVWLGLGLARAMILTFQFRRLAPLFGRMDGLNAVVPLVTQPQLLRAKQIKKTVAIAARYTPWVSNCFPTAIVARLLLGLYNVPYALYFGLDRDAVSDELKAHTWIASGPCQVTGGDGFETYTIVGCYGSQSWGQTP